MEGRVHRTTHDGVAILEIDNPPVNALSHSTRRALSDALARAESEPEVGAIVISARGKTFVVGDDITEFGQKPREPHLPDVVDRIEASPKPIVVAWHGTALGGGCEIGLAAHRRIMARDASVGLPEVRLGLIPGAGGTQRLPRLIGLPAALDLIATGRSVDAPEALAIGLCDEIVEKDIVAAATKLARRMVGKMQPRLSLQPPPPPDPGAWDAMVQKVRREARDRIAPLRAIDLVGQTATLPYSLGAPGERRAFLDLAASDQSRALRHLFLAERAVRVTPEFDGIEPGPLRRIGVVGAGAMGAGIALTLAGKGFNVAALESSEASATAGRARIAAMLARPGRNGRMPDGERNAILSRIGIVTDPASLSGCDLVIEAVSEDMPIKLEVLARLEALLRPDALIVTNTGYLDLEEMADHLTRPERFIGLHFYAPAQVIKLVEVARPRRSAPRTLATILDLARRLDKIAVRCGPTEGLIGNRILAKFRSQCEFMLEEGAMPAEIDRALETFGLAIGPFAAQDMAGLEISRARRKRQAASRNPGERDVDLVDRLCEMGRLGQKTGRGWYRYPGGRRENDPEVEAVIREHAARSGRRRQTFTPEAIQRRVLAAMVNEGAKILNEKVAARPLEIDLVFVHGFGFPAYRGGPMQEADTQGLRSVLAIAEDNAMRDGAGFETSRLLVDLASTGRSFATLNTE